ncbi:DEAD/DEAH box helicase [Singulisphaera sp. PoT]|uniref:DEAD/DEAH box helicase n=1 Tax=Singulisphaera sp. PoT TaxID=3411797 RepID=UPI003BF5E835
MLPPVANWFRETFGEETPPQREGWPAIASGQNTLIFAPTGSGKTLAAFLAALDHLWRHPRIAKGSRILYISPLKALNQDVYRNLQVPLDGILKTAESMGFPLPELTIGIRSGDTPTAERRKLVSQPPDILITTPESLHLMLTSRARETLRSISHLILDEIHAVCSNKRGVFLALLLERLQAISSQGFVRIGLSATQRPLEEVARYLGGFSSEATPGRATRFKPRPVTIVDTGQRKVLDLEVLVPFESSRPMAAGTTWPAIEQRVLGLIREHQSTIVFANNRRVVERLTSRLNESSEEEGIAPEAFARSHHGSLNLEERRGTEEALKQGELKAVVATASLELGIDMGAVDLVCQVESPGNVSRGLQRVGRAGHLVGRVSKGRLIAKTSSDLVESAALARAMVHGEVETLRVPSGCLDVLAQQVVACVAVDAWEARNLFDLVRQAYPYRNLTADAFESVLKMVSGRFPTEPFRDLRARVSWDRVHHRLLPLPGTARLAITGGGTIPDTGQFPVYLGAEGPRLGELDEEFVFERRVGETFVLGTATWRIEAIEPQRVVVASAQGQSAMMPFWRGEDAPRSPELGEAVGTLCREISSRLDDSSLVPWLQEECKLEPSAAASLRDHVARQVRIAGAVPDDHTVVIETFRDPAGELGIAVLTPFGGKLHHALKLVFQARVRQRFGIAVSCLHGDEGVLIRFPKMDEPPLDLFQGLTSALGEELIREELGESALFGLRFRQNAGRALLMPRPDPTKRTPLWLQRLRAKDLLQVVRKFPDFPIVVETYRECLDDDLDIGRFKIFLDHVSGGEIRVVARRSEIASPFVSDLVFRFTQEYIYQWDEPKRTDRRPVAGAIDDALLSPLLEENTRSLWLDPDAIARVENRLRGSGKPPRTVEEMAEMLRRLGDLTPSELAGPMLGFLNELEGQGRAVAIELPGTAEPTRWIGAEEADLYRDAFVRKKPDAPSLEQIILRFLETHALIGLDDLAARYPIKKVRAAELLESWEEAGRLVRLDPTSDSGAERWADQRNLDEVRRLSIAIRRRESVAVTPEIFADFVAHRQHVHPSTRWEGNSSVGLVLEQLQGFAAPADLWETEILPRRILDYRPNWLDETLSGEGWIWRASDDGKGSSPRVAFVLREFAGAWPVTSEGSSLGEVDQRVLGHLRERGATFVLELARSLALEPSQVRNALARLVREGHVTNDRFDPLRPGGNAMGEALARANSPGSGSSTRLRRSMPRRPSSQVAEGRWSSLGSTSGGDEEASLLSWAAVLLERYGVLTRETTSLDPWAPPWRELAPKLDRAELRGELRRGYFVEGLSGIQYATPEAADELARFAANQSSDAPMWLVSTLDPANLYGAGAVLDIELLEGGTARLPRSSSNFLVIFSGRPILIIEAFGKRLTGLGSASEEELIRALALLPSLAGPARRVLKVETYNSAATLASPAAPWLANLGFVRDYPGMAYYAGW